MKQVVLFLICFVALATSAISQPVVTDASNKRIMEWDSGYRIEAKRFFDIYYQYTVKKQDQLIAEYLRYDDSCYFFLSYDSAGKRHQHGFIKLNTNPFECDTLAVVNWKADLTGSKGITKDTLVCNESYRKEGYWKETDSSGMIWRGMYKNGAREGKWAEGTYFILPHAPAIISEALYDNFKPYLKHQFKNGFEISRFKDSIFWPKIKGDWSGGTMIDSVTVVLTRTHTPTILRFLTENKVVYRKPHLQVDFKSKKSNNSSFWKQKDDLIEITDDGKNIIVKVLSLSEYQLIVQVIKWEK